LQYPQVSRRNEYSFRQREIHYQQNAIVRNCLSAIREDGMGLLVIPVHNHVFHQLCPAAGGHLAEEIAVHYRAAGFQFAIEKSSRS